MGRSLFLRMLFVYILIIVMSFTLLGGFFFESLKSDFLNTQMDQMIEDAKIINEWATQNYSGEMSDTQFSANLVQKGQGRRYCDLADYAVRRGIQDCRPGRHRQY